MQKLFTCLYGSRLYGTQTPTSDLDVKHIVLPDLDQLLLGKKVSNTVHKTNNAKNTRNGVDDIDEEFIPLQVFARDFVIGQTYALELAFALDGSHAQQEGFDPRGDTHNSAEHGWQTKVMHDFERAHWSYEQPLFVEFTQELRTKFLTSNIKAMMGYVVNQANLYSFKGERLNVAREFREFLMKGFMDPECGTDPLSDFVTVGKLGENFEALQAKYPKYFKITEYDIGGGRMRPCFMLLEKTFPFTNTLDHSLLVVDTIIKKYGSRADQASESNVDWKATMHALRIVDEGLLLLDTHQLRFPFEQDYIDFLLAVKRGERPLDPIRAELESKLDLLKTLEQQTTLPESNAALMQEFEAWLLVWLHRFYAV